VLDFRYHALSIVAVFLALGIGIVLGASLGDSVVSQANRDVRSSLRGDLIDARNSARGANRRITERDRFDTLSFAYIAGNKLRGRRVAIVSSGDLPQEVENSARNAVKDAGGSVDSVSRFDAKPDLGALGDKLGRRYQQLGTASAELRPLARRIGVGLVSGSRLARRLEDAFPDDFAGDFKGADAVVFYRADAARDTDGKTFESAVIEGLRAAGVPVVGVERTPTDPSQIPYYVNAGLSTVDDLEIPPGRIALVLALAGRNGNFGFKETAEAPLPSPPASAGG
jgi:hypothetical protein